MSRELCSRLKKRYSELKKELAEWKKELCELGCEHRYPGIMEEEIIVRVLRELIDIFCRQGLIVV